MTTARASGARERAKLWAAAVFATAVIAFAGLRDRPAIVEDPPHSAPSEPAPAEVAPERATATEEPPPFPLGPRFPPSERVFVVPRADGAPLVLGADGAKLWVAELAGDEVRRLSTVEGKGVVQLVTAGDFGRGHHVYVARGRSLSHPLVPLVLLEVDLATMKSTELWEHSGPRNDAVYLGIADVDRDGEVELALAHFTTNHIVTARHMHAEGEMVAGEERHMATTRAYGDVDGDGRDDAIVGNLYAGDEDGFIRVELTDGWHHVPTDHGVRALAWQDGAVLFADGWTNRYTTGTAVLREARYRDGGFHVETLGKSEDEYTFNVLVPFSVGSERFVAAAGNRRVTVFAERPDGWFANRVAQAPSVASIAILPAGDCALLLVPGPNGTHSHRVCETPRGER